MLNIQHVTLNDITQLVCMFIGNKDIIWWTRTHCLSQLQYQEVSLKADIQTCPLYHTTVLKRTRNQWAFNSAVICICTMHWQWYLFFLIYDHLSIPCLVDMPFSLFMPITFEIVHMCMYNNMHMYYTFGNYIYSTS